jgi:hypothetical protein
MAYLVDGLVWVSRGSHINVSARTKAHTYIHAYIPHSPQLSNNHVLHVLARQAEDDKRVTEVDVDGAHVVAERGRPKRRNGNAGQADVDA